MTASSMITPTVRPSRSGAPPIVAFDRVDKEFSNGTVARSLETSPTWSNYRV
jgi:hypothetical protein